MLVPDSQWYFFICTIFLFKLLQPLLWTHSLDCWCIYKFKLIEACMLGLFLVKGLIWENIYEKISCPEHNFVEFRLEHAFPWVSTMQHNVGSALWHFFNLKAQLQTYFVVFLAFLIDIDWYLRSRLLLIDYLIKDNSKPDNSHFNKIQVQM